MGGVVRAVRMAVGPLAFGRSRGSLRVGRRIPTPSRLRIPSRMIRPAPLHSCTHVMIAKSARPVPSFRVY
jgi:hypothetical protein